MSNLDYITATNKYGKYCIPTSTKHRISARTVIRGEVWEEETVDYIIEHCKHDLVHAGAYFGDMFPAFSTNIEKVWTFEPNKENYECALNTIKWNNLTNIYLKNAALGKKSGTANLQTEGIRNNKMVKLGGASHIATKKLLGDTEPVNVVTIDDTVPEDRMISIIQLDVEDYELYALQGALKTIERCSPVLILETKHNKVEPTLQIFLEQLDYKKICNVYHDVNSVWERVN